MIITWVTLDYVNESVVEYGIDTLGKSASGSSVNFTDGGVERRKLNIHRVLLNDLIPGQTYRNTFLNKKRIVIVLIINLKHIMIYIRLSLWIADVRLVNIVLVHSNAIRLGLVA